MTFSTIIDAATLAAHLGEPDWCVLDVRHQLADTTYGESAYRAGHVPGAHFLHCDRDLSGPMNGRNGRHPLPDATVFARKIARCGVAPTVQVVVYDDAQGMIAGRLWWMLRALGHPRVAVLDGGWQAWQAAQGAVDTAIPPESMATLPAAKTFSPVQADALCACLNDGKTLVVDARSPDRFRGENETMDPVGGHIPGAVNRFFRDNLAADGRFKPAAQLRAEWLALLGDRCLDDVVHQCGSGVSACHNLLALDIAGLPGSRLYAGSWSEWCADPSRPVTR